METKQITINNIVYNCVIPEECTFPEETKIIKKIVDNDRYVLAKILYRGKYECLAVRWHISDRQQEKNINGEICVGYPSMFKKPAWFVIPDELWMHDIQTYLLGK